MSSPNTELASTHLAVSWLGTLLYMLVITLAVYYLSRFTPKRNLKLLLYAILLADTICMVCIYTSACVLLIRTEISPPYNSRDSLWMVSVSTSMLTILAVIEELFLINRCRKLEQPLAFTIMLLAMVVSHAALNLYSGLYIVGHNNLDPDYVRYGNKAALVIATLAATVDVLVPLALTWQLYNMTPLEISKQRSYRDIIINAVSSGGFGGIMRIILLILFWTKPDIFYVLSTTMGGIYAITLLVNLLVSTRRTAAPSHSPKTNSINSQTGISLASFTVTRMSLHKSPSIIDREKQLPPTPM